MGADSAVGIGLKTQNWPNNVNAPFGEYFINGVGESGVEDFQHQAWLFAGASTVGASTNAPTDAPTNAPTGGPCEDHTECASGEKCKGGYKLTKNAGRRKKTVNGGVTTL